MKVHNHEGEINCLLNWEMVKIVDLLEVCEKMSCGIGSSQSLLELLLSHHVTVEIIDSWIIFITNS